MKSMVNQIISAIAGAALLMSCEIPKPEKVTEAPRLKHNYIVLLDLSDRLIVQENQPERDKEIIKNLYSLFEDKVRRDLYIKSGDEIKIVMAPQRGTRLRRDVFEDRLYVNMNYIDKIARKPKEEERRAQFYANVDTLYQQAVFSKNPKDYHGADIWKYFYEDLAMDYSRDAHTENYLFILTDGYPIVGHNQKKLFEINNEFPDLHVVLLEASPREKDMEWDHVMGVWQDWFDEIGIAEYTLIKRGSITKELEQVRAVVGEQPLMIAYR
ncbi:MAG: hypothetical protein RLN86_01375 [Cyclobacteriaceae bacterium]